MCRVPLRSWIGLDRTPKWSNSPVTAAGCVAVKPIPRIATHRPNHQNRPNPQTWPQCRRDRRNPQNHSNHWLVLTCKTGGWLSPASCHGLAHEARERSDEAATLSLEIERDERGRNETIGIAVQAFELWQTLRAKWITVDYAAKRRIIENICLNGTLDDEELFATIRKPSDLLAKGLISKGNRAGRI